MIILIGGASHTGKTALSQRLLEKYHYPYFSIDHLKMGLIRSGRTTLTPESDCLTDYLWPIVREIIKTAIENKQNLIVEGCYIPFTWQNDFSSNDLAQIRYVCLVMTKDYIVSHFSDIKRYSGTIEKRLDDTDLTQEVLIKENTANYELCQKYGCDYILIDKEYKVDWPE